MGASKPRYSSAAIAQALRDTQGNVVAASRLLGSCSETVRRRVYREPRLKALRAELYACAGDELESEALSRALDRESPDSGRMLTFLLRTRYHDRGYSERLQIGLELDVAELQEFVQAVRAIDVDPAQVIRRVTREALEQARAEAMDKRTREVARMPAGQVVPSGRE